MMLRIHSTLHIVTNDCISCRSVAIFSLSRVILASGTASPWQALDDGSDARPLRRSVSPKNHEPEATDGPFVLLFAPPPREHHVNGGEFMRFKMLP